MRLLLDECVPQRLKHDFPEHVGYKHCTPGGVQSFMVLIRLIRVHLWRDLLSWRLMNLDQSGIDTYPAAYRKCHNLSEVPS